jgi:phosphatidate cytidylyltransferase
MTRVLSGAVLLTIAVAVVWFAPPVFFLAVAELVLVAGCVEYVGLARASGLDVPFAPAAMGAALTSLGIASTYWIGGIPRSAAVLDVVLMTSFIALAAVTLAEWRGERDALARIAAAVFPALYLGFPVGAMVSIQALHGHEKLFLLMLTVIASDIGQYYSGRLFGRTLLAPIVSPKKTAEGAAGGFVCGILIMVVAGGWWLPVLPVLFRGLLGGTIVALGIGGDLFESMLKRSAGVKDSSSVIPGHGGILDRIDALLFAAPVYYVVLKYT